MHVATAHHLKTTKSVDALLNAVRTDIPLITLQVPEVTFYRLTSAQTR